MVKLLIISIIILTFMHVVTLIYTVIQRMTPRVLIRSDSDDVSGISREDRIYFFRAKYFLRHLEYVKTRKKLEKEIRYYSFLLIVYFFVLNSLVQPPLFNVEYVKPYVIPIITVGVVYTVLSSIRRHLKNKKINQKADRRLGDIEQIFARSSRRGNI